MHIFTRSDIWFADIRNLEPYTAYEIQVRGFTRKGDGKPSELVTLTTREQGRQLPRGTRPYFGCGCMCSPSFKTLAPFQTGKSSLLYPFSDKTTCSIAANYHINFPRPCSSVGRATVIGFGGCGFEPHRGSEIFSHSPCGPISFSRPNAQNVLFGVILLEHFNL